MDRGAGIRRAGTPQEAADGSNQLAMIDGERLGKGNERETNMIWLIKLMSERN